MRVQAVKGACEICGSSITKGTATRHLDRCVTESEPEQMAVLQIRAVAPRTPYWIQFDVNEVATLLEIDDFLRGMWLECCDHLSAFQVGDTTYSPVPIDVGFRRQCPMKTKLQRALLPGTKFGYEYDFGSTTELALEVISRRMVANRKSAVRLLARNDAPVWPCDECDSPAVSLCSECQYDRDAFFCADHAPEHECGEEMMLPVVNSPRMGVCGYAG